MCWRSKPANRALKSGNDTYIYILTSLTPTEPKSAFTQFIVTTRELVKIEGGAKVGTAHSQGKVANDLN